MLRLIFIWGKKLLSVFKVGYLIIESFLKRELVGSMVCGGGKEKFF